MKTTGYRTILAILLFISISANAQVAEKEINMEFKANKDSKINIDSKFGKVEILNWDKPLITVDVKLTAESENKDLGTETLDKLYSEITKEGEEIFIKTIIEERIVSTPGKKVKFSIDYTIYAPVWINVKLLNKYGTVFIERIDGTADITVQYGNLTIRELGRQNDKPINQLILAYSRGTIDKASWLKADLSYSKLSIDEARAVVAITKYSSFSGENISSLVSDSKYDTYSVNTLSNYAGQMRYANLKINELSGKCDITSSYTNVKFENILPGFESIVIDNSRGNYKLNISRESSFSLNAETSRGDIVVEGMNDLNNKTVNSDKSIWGTYGDADSGGEIKIKSTDGNIRITIL